MRLYSGTYFFSFVLLVISISTAVMFNACNEPTPIGSDLIDENEFHHIKSTDTFNIETHIVETDSILTAPFTSGGLARTYLLGSLNDSEFGTSEASIYTQVRLTGTDVDLGSNLQLDSVVLTLVYDDTDLWGDTSATIDIDVFQLNDTLAAGEVFYSNKEFSYSPFSLGNKQNCKLNPTDSTEVYGIYLNEAGEDSIGLLKVEPHIRIRLNDSFGESLLAQSGQTAFSENAEFLKYLKGLYIKATSIEGLMVRLSMIASRSRLTLYYKKENSDFNQYHFQINEYCAVINHFKNDHSQGMVQNTLNAPYPNAQELIPIQAMGGIRTNIHFPSLKNFSNKAINKAELEVFALASEPLSAHANPNQLVIVAINDEIPDETDVVSVGNSTPKDTSTNPGLQVYKYLIPLTVYSQQQIAGLYDDYVQQIFIGQESAHADRCYLAGPQHPDYPMRLRVFYTDIE